jgi:hypothetical protein
MSSRPRMRPSNFSFGRGVTFHLDEAYDGENVVGFGDNLFAVPIPALWQASL